MNLRPKHQENEANELVFRIKIENNGIRQCILMSSGERVTVENVPKEKRMATSLRNNVMDICYCHGFITRASLIAQQTIIRRRGSKKRQ